MTSPAMFPPHLTGMTSRLTQNPDAGPGSAIICPWPLRPRCESRRDRKRGPLAG
ncbi:hypothetical protein MMMB2_4964 [Mycobacterium marinum MB2]|nr:hypothetical protein MMMB2_4964 [Mycobacterium marinum MB2]